jgi:TolB-like protein
MNLRGFFKECNEKEVFKMLSIYVVSSWVILQVLALIAEPLNFPEKSVTYLILILIIGFPIYVFYIWKFHLKKLEKEQTSDDSIKIYKSSFHKMYFSGLIIIASISAFSAVIIINKNLMSDFSLREASDNDKIAVLQFENFTGDPKQDVIGDMAANWIVHGITENELAQVISPKVVSDYTSIIKSQAGMVADAKNLLKTYFKPGKVVTGGFYQENGKLLLQASIMDGLFDRTLISFPTIECDPGLPLDCIEELKQKILGYLSISKDVKDGTNFEETPPKFQAYQYNLSAINHVDNDSLHLDYLNKAIKADPNYFEPKILLITHYLNNREYRTADSLIKRIDMNSKLSSRQKNYLFEFESILKGRYDKAYKALKKEYEIAYMDMPTNQSTMVLALQYVNRPKDVDDIYNEIPMDTLDLDKCYNCGNRYYIKGLADIEQKKYQQVIEELLPISKVMETPILKKPLIMAYVRSGDLTSLNEQFGLWELSMEMEDKKELLQLYMFAGNEFLLDNKKENAKVFFNKVIHDGEQIKDSTDVAYAYYYNQDYKTAQELLEKLHANNLKNVNIIVKLAISNYKNGNYPEADQYIKSLDTLRASYQFGEIDYGIAQYYATINDKENTFDYLRKAVASGRWFTTTSFQNDPHFLIYKDSQEFNDILNYWNQYLDL